MAGLFEGIRSRFNRGNIRNTEDVKRNEAMSGDATKLSDYDVYKIINNLRDTNNSYKQKYAEYDEMSHDDIIGSALELYADDSTQMDTDTSRRITVVSKSGVNLRKDIESFLESINADSRIWDWAYQTATYGDFYLKVVRDKKGQILYLEEEDDPSSILDLFYMGVRVNYAREVPEEERTTQTIRNNQLEYEFHDRDQYVHFMIRSTDKSDKFYVEVTDPGTDKMEVRKYKVVRGTSMIDKARTSHRILTLLEDSLLAARIAKAEYFRIYNVEVGANATPQDSRKAIARVKNLFDSKPRMDMRKGTYVSSKQLRPIGDPIFNPVREGKGSIDHTEVGGEFEVKSIVDIDYFKDKKFSALKVPKALLGFEDGNLAGGLGDTTATLQDMRYARSVKKVSSAVAQGIKDIVNLWLKSLGRDNDVDQFEIVLTSPSSSEELMRLKELELRVDTATKVLELSRDFSDFVDLPKLTKDLLGLFAEYPQLQDVLSDAYGDASKRWMEERGEEEELQEEVPKEMSGSEIIAKVLEDPELLAKIVSMNTTLSHDDKPEDSGKSEENKSKSSKGEGEDVEGRDGK